MTEAQPTKPIDPITESYHQFYGEDKVIRTQQSAANKRIGRVSGAGYLAAGAIILSAFVRGCSPTQYVDTAVVRSYKEIARQVELTKMNLNIIRGHVSMYTDRDMSLANPVLSNLVASTQAQGREYVSKIEKSIKDTEAILAREEADDITGIVREYKKAQHKKEMGTLVRVGYAGALWVLSLMFGVACRSFTEKKAEKKRHEAYERHEAREKAIKASQLEIEAKEGAQTQ